MSEVDWLIDQFAQILDDRDAELAALRGVDDPSAAVGPAGDPDHRGRSDGRGAPHA